MNSLSLSKANCPVRFLNYITGHTKKISSSSIKKTQNQHIICAQGETKESNS